MLLLHGWGSNARLMLPIAEALAGRYRVYTLDLPGHGLSPQPPEAWGIPEHAALVEHFLEDRIGAPTTIIGHSNGGRIALYMAGEPQPSPWIERLVPTRRSVRRRALETREGLGRRVAAFSVDSEPNGVLAILFPPTPAEIRLASPPVKGISLRLSSWGRDPVRCYPLRVAGVSTSAKPGSGGGNHGCRIRVALSGSSATSS